MRVIPQRELRNSITEVLREVESGQSLRVTVRGRPVADLVPVRRERRWVPRAAVEAIIRDVPLDPGFESDLDDALGQTVDEV